MRIYDFLYRFLLLLLICQITNQICISQELSDWRGKNENIDGVKTSEPKIPEKKFKFQKDLEIGKIDEDKKYVFSKVNEIGINQFENISSNSAPNNFNNNFKITVVDTIGMNEEN